MPPSLVQALIKFKNFFYFEEKDEAVEDFEKVRQNCFQVLQPSGYLVHVALAVLMGIRCLSHWCLALPLLIPCSDPETPLWQQGNCYISTRQ